jgi:hypothetical protein
MSLNVTSSNLKYQHVPDSFNGNASKLQIDVLKPSQNKMIDDDNNKAAKDNSPSSSSSIDAFHKEKRKRNNASAKKSRDARFKREEAIALRAIATENENTALKARIQFLEDELRELRNLLFKQQKQQQHNPNENIELKQ